MVSLLHLLLDDLLLFLDESELLADSLRTSPEEILRVFGARKACARHDSPADVLALDICKT